MVLLHYHIAQGAITSQVTDMNSLPHSAQFGGRWDRWDLALELLCCDDHLTAGWWLSWSGRSGPAVIARSLTARFSQINNRDGFTSLCSCLVFCLLCWVLSSHTRLVQFHFSVLTIILHDTAFNPQTKLLISGYFILLDHWLTDCLLSSVVKINLENSHFGSFLSYNSYLYVQ